MIHNYVNSCIFAAFAFIFLLNTYPKSFAEDIDTKSDSVWGWVRIEPSFLSNPIKWETLTGSTKIKFEGSKFSTTLDFDGDGAYRHYVIKGIVTAITVTVYRLVSSQSDGTTLFRLPGNS